MGKCSSAAESIFNLLDKESKINSDSMDGETPLEIHGEIKLENVNFEYPSRPQVSIFKSFNLEIKAGTTVGIVGASGGIFMYFLFRTRTSCFKNDFLYI